MFDELLKTFDECQEPDWDGYGAQPVLDTTCQLAQKFLEIFPPGTPAPSIGAEPDGHVTVEWYGSPQRTLSVSVGPDGALDCAALLGEERICGTERFRSRMPQVLIDLITRIKEVDPRSFST